jgi:hypothetical protein
MKSGSMNVATNIMSPTASAAKNGDTPTPQNRVELKKLQVG